MSFSIVYFASASLYSSIVDIPSASRLLYTSSIVSKQNVYVYQYQSLIFNLSLVLEVFFEVSKYISLI